MKVRKYTVFVGLLLTPAESAVLRQMAGQGGRRKVSAFLRRLVADEAERCGLQVGGDEQQQPPGR